MKFAIDSDFFYRLRGVAIISVAYAHSLSLENYTLSRIGQLIGLIGVPLFLICSGYFFKRQNIDCVFLRHKFKTIILPWLIWGSFAFCLSIYLGTKHFSIIDFWAYLFGHGTWLYYVPVYFCILLIYNLIHFPGGDYILMLISVLSNIVSYYCNLSGLDAWITFYQNPFNFMLFFSLGKILKENSIIEKIKGIYVFPLISLIIIIGYFFIKYNLKISYINPLAICFELVSVFIIFYLTNVIRKFSVLSSSLEEFGKNSYIIYFLHMQIGIAAVNRIMSLGNIRQEYILLSFKPICVIIVTYILVKFLSFIFHTLNLDNYKRLVGIGS